LRRADVRRGRAVGQQFTDDGWLQQDANGQTRIFRRRLDDAPGRLEGD
jgi:hypothetical protein